MLLEAVAQNLLDNCWDRRVVLFLVFVLAKSFRRKYTYIGSRKYKSHRAPETASKRQ